MKDIFRDIRRVGILTGIPILLVAGPTLGFFAGMWLDEKTGKEPWFTAALIILGCLGSAKETLRLIRWAANEEDHPA